MYSDYLAFEVLSTDNQHYRVTICTVTINNNKCMYNCLKEKKNLNLVSWIETHGNDDEKKRINMDEVEKYEWNSFDPVVNFVYTNREKK